MNFLTAQKFKIKYVNGFLIRNTLDADFALAHRHTLNCRSFSSKSYIPPDELWIDHHFKDETEFLQRVLFYKPKKTHLHFSEEREEKKKHLSLPPPVPAFIVRKRRHYNGQIRQHYYVHRSKKEPIAVTPFVQSRGMCGPASLKILLSYFIGKENKIWG